MNYFLIPKSLQLNDVDFKDISNYEFYGIK